MAWRGAQRRWYASHAYKLQVLHARACSTMLGTVACAHTGTCAHICLPAAGAGQSWERWRSRCSTWSLLTTRLSSWKTSSSRRTLTGGCSSLHCFTVLAAGAEQVVRLLHGACGKCGLQVCAWQSRRCSCCAAVVGGQPLRGGSTTKAVPVRAMWPCLAAKLPVGCAQRYKQAAVKPPDKKDLFLLWSLQRFL